MVKLDDLLKADKTVVEKPFCRMEDKNFTKTPKLTPESNTKQVPSFIYDVDELIGIRAGLAHALIMQTSDSYHTHTLKDFLLPLKKSKIDKR